MKSEEGYIDVPGGKVWYRAVGDNAEATPLLCLHGGPGFTHYYLEALEALADRRRVIFYDQLGCGRSDRPGDLTLWNVDRFVEELAQVRSALKLDRLHLSAPCSSAAATTNARPAIWRRCTAGSPARGW